MPNTCRWVSPVGDTNKAGNTQVCACVCVCVCVCARVCVQCQLSNTTCTLPSYLTVQEQYRNNIGTI